MKINQSVNYVSYIAVSGLLSGNPLCHSDVSFFQKGHPDTTYSVFLHLSFSFEQIIFWILANPFPTLFPPDLFTKVHLCTEQLKLG